MDAMMKFNSALLPFVAVLFVLLPTFILSHPLTDGVPNARQLMRFKRLVNGSEVKPHSWPSLVLLEAYNSGIKCGGVLLSPNWILTTAHCFRKYPNTDRPECWTAVIGMHNRSAHEPSQQFRSIESINVHHNFDIRYADDDIALIRVQKPFQISPEAQTASITPDYKEFDKLKCKLIAVKEEYLQGVYAFKTVVEAIDVPIAKQAVCLTIDPANKTSDYMICGGSKSLTVGSTWGDSGSPLLCKEDGKWLITGLLSWGPPDEPKISVYVKVSKYTQWIDKVMKEYTPRPPITKACA